MPTQSGQSKGEKHAHHWIEEGHRMRIFVCVLATVLMVAVTYEVLVRKGFLRPESTTISAECVVGPRAKGNCGKYGEITLNWLHMPQKLDLGEKLKCAIVQEYSPIVRQSFGPDPYRSRCSRT